MSVSAVPLSVEPMAPSFVDRRNGEPRALPANGERRQFSDGHDELSPAARELALAVDQYKLSRRRRFITYEEMLDVMKSLGYAK
jgi:hypothetical protein